ncbi:hypothetical protein KA005_74245 [bacterium]|nr:hypothetical protein [bacterium]
MKHLVILLGLVFLLGSVAFAEEYTIRPMYPDFTPNDGFMDKGTCFNPYVVEDQYGREIGEIRSAYPDFDPNDGFMDAGTWSNPYTLETYD